MFTLVVDYLANRRKKLYLVITLNLADESTVKYPRIVLKQPGRDFYVRVAPPFGTVAKPQLRASRDDIGQSPLRNSACPKGA